MSFIPSSQNSIRYFKNIGLTEENFMDDSTLIGGGEELCFVIGYNHVSSCTLYQLDESNHPIAIAKNRLDILQNYPIAQIKKKRKSLSKPQKPTTLTPTPTPKHPVQRHHIVELVFK